MLIEQTSSRYSRWLIHGFFILLTCAMILPFMLIVSISLSDEQSLIRNGYRYIPEAFSLHAYKVVLQAPMILLRAYGVTLTVTVVGTIVGLIMTSMLAYAVSRRDFRYRRPITFYIFFTMLFSGGLVPFYILVTQYLQMKDTIYALIIPYLLNPFYVMVMKGFMDQLPAEVFESAKIDGAGEYRIFFRIAMPMSLPALATVGLFISFVYWNDWWLGLLFINKDHLAPLQLLLYRVMSTIDFLSSNPEMTGVEIDMSQFPNLSARMAIALLAAGPMLFIFPLFQKYFVKGLTVGSLKG